MGATEILCRWVHDLRYEDIPPRVIERAKDQLLSILGAMLAGSRTEAGIRIISAVRTWEERPESTIVGGSFKCSMRTAGLVNSVNAQVLEFDDWVGDAHAGAAVVPAALAVGEAVDASGKELLTAQVAGNEVAARVVDATVGGRGTGNLHACHQVEVPLVAGKLLGLNVTQLMDAVGGACAQAEFPAVVSWTSHSKGYLTGMPVYVSITAACIAKHGFSGNHEIVEAPRGYCYETQGILDPEKLVKGLGEKWWLGEALTIKPYPMCGFTMAAADALLKIVNENFIDPRKIERIVVRCPLTLLASGTMFAAIPDLYERIRRREETGYCWIPLLFDLKYPLAVGVVDREITPKQFTYERIFDPLVQEVLKKIEVETDLTLDLALLEEPRRFQSEVTIIMEDGKKFSEFTEQHRGAPNNPFDVSEKFRIGARGILSREDQEKVIRLVRNAEKLKNVKELTELLLVGE